MDGRVFLPSVYQSITAPPIAGRSGFRWISTPELIIWALAILQCIIMATAFSTDVIFHQMFTILTYEPVNGGVDYVPTNETESGITLVLMVGLWKIYYTRGISQPTLGSSFQLEEAHYTVLKTISDACLNSGIRTNFCADSARLLLGLSTIFIFCNFLAPLVSRRVFIFTVLASGFSCLYGILFVLVWLSEIIQCNKAISFNRPWKNESQMLFYRTFDARPVVPASSFQLYLVCGIISMVELPFLVYRLRTY